MSDAKPDLEINLAEMVNLAAKLLHTLFQAAPKDKAKPIFKEIKHGKTVALGSVTLQEKLTSNLTLALDYSEFRGPGFNFDVFKTALEGILRQISHAFQTRGELNVMNSDDGTVLIHLPGAVQQGDQLNVLVLAFEFGDIHNVVVKLMFIDPSQYEPYRRDKPPTADQDSAPG